MNKQVKVTSNSKQKDILKDALNSADNEQLDLYKAILGGTAGAKSGTSAYPQDVFTQGMV